MRLTSRLMMVFLFAAAAIDAHAATLQVTTLACNTEISLPPRKIIEDASYLYQPGVRRKLGLLEWPALIRKLDAIDPSYRE